MGLLDRDNDTIQDDFLTEECIVAEIGGADLWAQELPVSEAVMQRIKAVDENPEFVVVEVESGISKSKNNWQRWHLDKTAKLVNEMHPVGYKGHIPEDEDNTAFPEPQTLWVAAKVRDMGQAGSKLIMKGYLHTKEIREQVRLGMVNSVSIRSKSVRKRTKGGYFDILDFEPESIDWARKFRNGMPSRILAVTNEMEGGNTVDGKDIAAISETELREHNPSVVELIEHKATENATKTVSEMEDAVEAAKVDVDLVKELRTKLGIKEDENVLEAVGRILDEVEESGRVAVRTFIKEKIAAKVKSPTAQKLVARMIGEMEDISSLTDESEKEIEERIDTALSEDDEVKAVVSEMTDTRRGTGGSGIGQRRADPLPDSPRSRSGKMKVETRKHG